MTHTRFLLPVLLILVPAPAFAQSGADATRQAIRENEQQLLDFQADEARIGAALRARFETTVPEMVAYMNALASEHAAFQDRMVKLQTSDDGRLVAADTAAFWQVLSLQQRPVLRRAEFTSRQAAARQLDEALKTLQQRGGATAGVVPSLEAITAAEDLLTWTQEKRLRIDRMNRLIDEAIESHDLGDGSVDVLPTLAEAINEALALQARRRAMITATAEEQARFDAEATIQRNAYDAALLAELQRSEQRRMELEALLERERIEVEIDLRAIRAETAAMEAASIAKFEREINELRAERDRLAAELSLVTAQNAAEIQKIEEQAEVTRLRAIAQSPETTALLAPFLAEGYWQPGDRRNDIGLELRPMSWSRLKSFGVTNPTPDGLAQLIAVVNTRGFAGQVSGANTSRGGKHNDTMRPKLSLGTTFGQIDDAEREKLAEMQRLLRELGPTLVDLGMLDP